MTHISSIRSFAICCSINSQLKILFSSVVILKVVLVESLILKHMVGMFLLLFPFSICILSDD
jgi:hypothetical protein